MSPSISRQQLGNRKRGTRMKRNFLADEEELTKKKKKKKSQKRRIHFQRGYHTSVCQSSPKSHQPHSRRKYDSNSRFFRKVVKWNALKRDLLNILERRFEKVCHFRPITMDCRVNCKFVSG